MRLPAPQPRVEWAATPVSQLPAWPRNGRVGIDIETKDPRLKELGPGVRRGGEIVGVSFAIEDGPSHYLPVRHEGGGNLDVGHVTTYLKDQAGSFRGDLAGANLGYDLDFLAEAGVAFTPRFFRDVQVAEPLIDEHRPSFSLENIAGYHGLPGKDERLLHQAAEALGLDAKADLWRLPAGLVGIYATQDAALPLTILRRQERIIEDNDLGRVFDLESRLLPVLLRMRRRGVRIDYDRLDQVEVWAQAREVQALHELHRLTGVKVAPEDVGKSAVLAAALMAAGIECGKTEKTGQPSVTNDWLRTLTHPAGLAIIDARKFNKLRTTFVASRREHAVNGRIHATFNQLRRERDDGTDDEEGARYGRISCTNPNLQQEPARDPEIGPRWRSIYVPDEGGEWACADYSQQEARWVTHFAAISGCAGGEEARAKYNAEPDLDNYQMLADLCGIKRGDAKTIYLGLCYGMGSGKMARKLGLPTKMITLRSGRQLEVADVAGAALLTIFNGGAPYIQQLSDRCRDRAGSRGFIVTVGGRRCRFPAKKGGGWDWTHKALNRLIQGSAGDQTKTAMVIADDENIPMQIQVHDEIDLTIGDRKEVLRLTEIMKTAVPCTVAIGVDTKLGPSWGEAR